MLYVIKMTLLIVCFMSSLVASYYTDSLVVQADVELISLSKDFNMWCQEFSFPVFHMAFNEFHKSISYVEFLQQILHNINIEFNKVDVAYTRGRFEIMTFLIYNEMTGSNATFDRGHGELNNINWANLMREFQAYSVHNVKVEVIGHLLDYTCESNGTLYDLTVELFSFSPWYKRCTYLPHIQFNLFGYNTIWPLRVFIERLTEDQKAKQPQHVKLGHDYFAHHETVAEHYHLKVDRRQIQLHSILARVGDKTIVLTADLDNFHNQWKWFSLMVMLAHEDGPKQLYLTIEALQSAAC